MAFQSDKRVAENYPMKIQLTFFWRSSAAHVNQMLWVVGNKIQLSD